MTHSTKGVLITDLVLEIFRLNGALLAAGDDLSAPLGLTSARWQVMGTINERALPVPHIAREMGLTRQGVQRTVNILQKEGLVDITDNPHHKTARLAALSAKGAECFKSMMATQEIWANDLGEAQTNAALTGAFETLRRLRRQVETSS